MNALLLFMAIIILVCLSACGDSKPPPTPPAPTAWVLTLTFACDAEDGCGEPPFITFEERHPSKAACDAAGGRWLEPNANPSGALASFSCAGRT